MGGRKQSPQTPRKPQLRSNGHRAQEIAVSERRERSLPDEGRVLALVLFEELGKRHAQIFEIGVFALYVRKLHLGRRASAMYLEKKGYDNYVIYEKTDRVGGKAFSPLMKVKTKDGECFSSS